MIVSNAALSKSLYYLASRESPVGYHYQILTESAERLRSVPDEDFGDSADVLLATAIRRAAQNPRNAANVEARLLIYGIIEIVEHLSNVTTGERVRGLNEGDQLLEEASALLRKAADKMLCAYGAQLEL